MNNGRYHETPLPDGILELLADVFIFSAPGEMRGDVYTERQMNKRTRRDSGSMERIEAAPGYDSMRIEINQMESILEGADLSDDERCAWIMHHEGYKIAEIRRVLGVSDRIVKRLIRSALYKIDNTEYPYKGLGEVYYRETHREVYNEPKHCHEEPCSRLGYCRYAHIRGLEN